ncbi:ATP-dependent translocase ABCB1-like [Schistocerca cancellata]|uniref:ATP-dependent translocase ABCB1-like n=1 Tax=Schistocerca cancellata TaxID=274614 RepID=UPI0021189913|nr:ATP-dependent translocase ABCB1-like [Schistocerca cancellata]XP_049777246.1 ATP-dependent translocase ABCB1-like [Schistocerca cancellata]
MPASIRTYGFHSSQASLAEENNEEVRGKILRLVSVEGKPPGSKSASIDGTFIQPVLPQTEESIPPVSFFQLFRFSTAWERWLLTLGVVAAVGAGVGMPLSNLLFGDLTGVMVDFGSALANATAAGEQVPDVAVRVFLHGVRQFLIYSAILGAATFLFTYVCIFTFNYVGYRQIHRIRDLYLKSALQQDIGWYDTQQTGEFASRMSEDLTKLEDGIGEKVAMFVMYQVNVIGGVLMALVRGWELALVCLVSFPLIVASIVTTEVISSRLVRKELHAYGKAGGIAEEVLSGIRTVIAFGGQDKEDQRYNKKLEAAMKFSVKRNMINGFGNAAQWFCAFASYGLAFWYGVGLILRDRDYPESERQYDAATMLTVFLCVMMGSWMLGMASPFIEAFSIARGAAAKVYSVIDRESPINSMSEEGERLEGVKGDVVFKDVHFEYPTRKGVKILRGLNLRMKSGETVALVGSSGCGKSTCIQLIQRFYDPLRGAVELDGHDIRNLNVGWLRSQIGVVGQEPVLFQTTIAENIRYGRDTCTMEDIEEAAKMANAHDFISKLPQRYDTMVGQRGAQLSGGQKQRIAIARALVRRPKILLLDEATSALDTSSEAKVQAALDKASVGRTTIIVAHRLSTVRNADRIVVLSAGSVVEQGSHDELMELKGHYHALVTAQLSAAVKEAEEKAAGGERPELERMVSVRSEASSMAGSEGGPVEVQPEAPEEKVPDVGLTTVVRLNAPEWHLLVTGTVAALIAGAAFPLFAVFFGDVLGVLSLPDPEDVRSQANWYSVLFFVIAILASTGYFLQIYTYGVAGERLTTRLRRLAFSAMLRQEVAWFDDKNNSTGALCARLSGDAASVQAATGQRIGAVVQALCTLALSVIACLFFEWRLGLVAIAFIPVMVLAQYFDDRMVLKEAKRKQKSMEKATIVAVEAVGSIRTVAGLCRERQFHAKYMLELEPAIRLAKRNTYVRAAVFSLARSLGTFVYAICIYYGGFLIVSDGVPYQDVFKVTEALFFGTYMVATALSFAPNFRKGLNAASKIFYLLNRQPKVVDPINALDKEWTAAGDVSYSDVEFWYPTRPGLTILKGLDLEVCKGQTVALVGPSGCGKSTCIQLLERFYDAASGTVALDERDVSQVKMSSLRSQLGLVQQEPVLFDRTIAENIAYGDNDRDVSMDEIIEVAKKANIHKFITALPQGYETRMGEKGAQLSGGQKQRVAIARALVRNPRVLLLDEATSALDTESEKIVQEALDKAKEGRTCITIAHRLSTIQDADVICVISHGKVAEIGKHAELLAKRGIYYKLHSLQST